MNYSYKTNIGKVRKKNEDSCLVISNDEGDVFMMVFDGMGGHNQGDIASSQAQLFMSRAFRQKKKFGGSFDMTGWMKNTIKGANNFLNELTKTDPSIKGMGATFAAFLIHKNLVCYAYVGDTRAYVIKENTIRQISDDETYVNFLFKNKKISKEDMESHPSRHVVTNALGCYPEVNLNVFMLKGGFDSLLLCSDGLYNMVDEDKMMGIIRDSAGVESCIDHMIDEANDKGGVDNIAIAYCTRD